MCQTLFNIPNDLIWGLPVFGVGWLFVLWCLLGVALTVWLVRGQGWNADTRGQLVMFVLSGLAICFLPPRMHLLADGGMPIRGYGVMLLVAVTSAVALSVRRARQMGQDPELIFSAGTWLFVAGIAGARLFYVIEYWDRFQKPTLGETIEAILNVAQGGLVVYGSLLGGGLALFLFVRRHHLPWLAMCDLVVPGLILGMALGRLGCFLNGCCYGGASDLPWAVTFPWNTPPFIAQVQNGTRSLHGLSFGPSGDQPQPPIIAAVDPDSEAARHGLKAGDRVRSINDVPVRTVDEAEMTLLGIDNHTPDMTVSIRVAGDSQAHAWTVTGPLPRSRPVHPAQLYSAIDGLLLCGFLLAYSPFRRRDGELFAILLTVHPVSRFLLESIRSDEGLVLKTRMTISQNISVLLLVAGVLLWVYLLLKPAKLAWHRQPAAAG